MSYARSGTLTPESPEGPWTLVASLNYLSLNGTFVGRVYCDIKDSTGENFTTDEGVLMTEGNFPFNLPDQGSWIRFRVDETFSGSCNWQITEFSEYAARHGVPPESEVQPPPETAE